MADFDFRSDTVTRPTPGMLEAMVAAPLGDDVFGDDPTVAALEAETAELLGKEAALFVTTGTLSNNLALRTLVGPLQEVMCDYRAHVHVWEVGGIHATGAAVAPVVPGAGSGGFLSAADVRDHARTDNCLYHQPVTKLLTLENTLNGAVMPLRQMVDAVSAARALGLRAHLDGARLWNAVAASGVSAAEYAAPFDTVSVCLSKGLGAPVGSLLVGPRAQLDEARHFRKLMGGGWRQAGLLAAAGQHALRHHRERLAEDHEAAAELAEGLVGLGFAVQPPETNMVWCEPPAGLGAGGFDSIAARLHEEDRILVGGAYAGPAGRHHWGEPAKALRFVTHLQAGRPAVRALLGGLTRLLARR
jgi:threonine aldolase